MVHGLIIRQRTRVWWRWTISIIRDFLIQISDLQVGWNSTTITEMITVPLSLKSSLHFNQQSKFFHKNTRPPLQSLSHIQGHHCLAHSKLSDSAMSIMIVLPIHLLVTNSSSYICLQQVQTIMQRTSKKQGAGRYPCSGMRC